jgi:hypothetical protein
MGLFLDVLVIVVAIMLILLLVTQLFYPMFTGEPLFSLFRRSAVRAEIAKAEHALETVAEVGHLKKVVNEVQRRSAELEKKE